MLSHYIFTSILKCGDNAHNKRIPNFILSLPLEKVSSFLSAYFSGDGSFDKHSRAIVCDTVSEGLINDIEFLLLRYGIFSRKYKRTTKGGATVQEFYTSRGKKPKECTSYRLRISGKNFELFRESNT